MRLAGSWKLAPALLLALVLAASVCAQTNAGSITGTVFDPQQAAIPGVKVTATKLSTNVSQSATSSSAGVYNLPALDPGTYKIAAERAGFKKLVREPIRVESSGTAAVDLTLELGSTSSEVTVTAEAQILQETSPTIQYGVDLKQISEQPLANSSALSILALLPGVLGSPGVEQAAITTGVTAPGAGLSISGSPMGTVQFQADGVNNTSLYFGRIGLAFSTEAVSEVAVLQNSYSAEYRAAGGAIVSMTTRSGTNALHGTIFSYIQNDILNAAPWQNAFRLKGIQRYWRGGVDLGGPVYLPKLYHGRNRTFFFVGYEPLRQYAEFSTFARVATQLERQGDFSKSVYNSLTNQRMAIFQQFQPGSNTRIVEPANTPFPQFPNNVIPASLISPVGQKIISSLPLPNMPTNSVGENYSVFRHVRNSDNRYNIRLDQVLTPDNRLSFRFSQAPTKGQRSFLGGLAETVPTDSNTGTNSALNDTHTWGGNKVNELRMGFSRSNNVRRETDQQLAINGFQQFGFPSYLSRGMPNVGFGDNGVQSIGGDPGSYEIDNFFQVANVLSWTKGKHNLKAGVDYNASQQNLADYGNVGGTWLFSPVQTNIGSGNTGTVLGTPNANTGSALASALLGYPGSVSLAPAVIPYQYRWKYYAGFVQDDIRVTPRLTVSIGVRYQIEVPRSEKHHKQGYFVDQPVTLPSGAQQQGYVQLDGLGGAPDTLWPTRYNSIEPRVGFAWRLPHLVPGLQVMRGAYAITHVPTNGLFSSAIPDLSPKAIQLATTGAANGGWVQMDKFPLVLPAGGFVLPPQGKFTDIANVNALYHVNPDVTMPYVQQWNLGFGFQWGTRYGLDLNYVGNKSTNLFGPSAVFNAVNIAEYVKEFSAGLNMSQLVPNPQGITGANGQVIRVSRQDSLRPLSTLGDITDPLAQGFDARYNALQVNFVRRFSGGFQVSANYVWMKAMDDTSCMGQFCSTLLQLWGTGSPQLYGDSHSLEKSISVSDLPSTLRLNFNWDLPVGKGRTLLPKAGRALNQIVGNWKVSGNGGIQSGIPFQAYTGSAAGFPDDVAKIRPNIVSGVNPILPGWKANCNNGVTQICPYVNSLAVFAPPALLTVGTATRVMDYIRMPHTETFNVALMKEFPLHEAVRLQFRAEAYGVLNHVYFGTNQNYFTLYTGLSYVGVTTPAVTANNITTTYGDVGSNIGGNRTVQMALKLVF
ncbi:MAG TPA: carboxypeptidase regulatory-like domain-containing protein [Candidatus Acidoferrales bacterium]|nr:carboxypeptidase regulatory-like domain-containing protein [Candidatus Acidoferrales bacterium]